MDSVDRDQWLGEGRRVLEEEAQALRSLAARLDSQSWAAAVTLLLEAKGRVVVTGMGKSGAVGHKLAGTLASTGTPALFLHPAEAVHGDLGMLAPADVVIALSYSGETDEIRAILPTINRLNVPIVALTSNKRSTLAQSSAVVLDVAIGQEACPMNLAPTTSTTAMIAMGDALALTVMGARGFDAEDYARLHPAGSLGRRLTLRVADVMRTGENLAIVSQDAVMFDAVFAITNAHAGAAIVVDGDGRLTGLVTDGDIRRHLLDGQDLLQRSVFSVMNRKPGTVASDILAIEGLQRLDDFHPDPGSKAGEAPVVDAEGRPVGMLMLKDLVKAGIVLE
ncbi:arabinose 5-phosphate isomerase [Capsulimonas corticalis]|uniref:Arabinose 5-phosphate isomerase n=1 Tax=Capsulimonas corticalis TaxID=2219043 RepID=A0A402CY63_9BACT|nr:KpsF/GutQ family sugar-phosphate isomerase [Capsulimonas corticalis]BDI31421.1 arabinose 5-phosphate isomerase [Capsulimonas corticalis]